MLIRLLHFSFYLGPFSTFAAAIIDDLELVPSLLYLFIIFLNQDSTTMWTGFTHLVQLQRCEILLHSQLFCMNTTTI